MVVVAAGSRARRRNLEIGVISGRGSSRVRLGSIPHRYERIRRSDGGQHLAVLVEED